VDNARALFLETSIVSQITEPALRPLARASPVESLRGVLEAKDERARKTRRKREENEKKTKRKRKQSLTEKVQPAKISSPFAPSTLSSVSAVRQGLRPEERAGNCCSKPRPKEKLVSRKRMLTG
jgi:protein subunit release factor B